jgi:hypothetical protein
MAPVREVAFELECFEWADERLEVAGRWKGIGQRRLNRPVLTVELDGGRRKRIVALPGGHLGAVGESWRATFSWPGDPGDITGAALEVGGNLVVDLPLPDRKRRRRRRAAVDAAGDEALRAEVGALRGQVERLRAELAGREREIIALRAQLDETTEEEPEVERAGAEERTVEIQRLAGELERLRDEQAALVDERTVEVQQLARERDEARAELSAGSEAREAEHARFAEELDTMREAFSDAAAEAEAARDRHNAQVGALEEALAAERAEVARLGAELAAALAAPRPPVDDLAASGDETADGDAPRAAAGPPTQPMPDPFADDDTTDPDSEAAAVDQDAPAAGAGAERGAAPARGGGDALRAGWAGADDDEPDVESPAAGPPTEPMPGPDPTAVEAAVLDAPGPQLAGGRPAVPPGAEDAPRVSRVPDWLRGGGNEHDAAGSPLQALRERFEGLFASNGHAEEGADEADVEPAAVPRPRRSASAARARAAGTVAARRSATEIWGMRVLAAVVVAVLLIAFVLVITSIA